MDNSKKYLVITDVPSIKDYVFGTDRLVEIRGASALLDRLNRIETERFLRKKLGEPNVECIYSNGGSAQFILQGDEGDLTHTLDELKGHFFRESNSGLKLVYGIAALSGTSYADALNMAFLALRDAKDQYTVISAPLPHTGYVRECDSCSAPAAIVVKGFDEEMILCDTCVRKTEDGKRRGLWKELASFVSRKLGVDAKAIENARPGSFEEIGEQCQARKGYTALVYADGNGMGKLIKAIDAAEDFRYFSSVVDQSIREACYEALLECFPSADRIPADILLLGGDDLLVYITAEKAMPFAISVAKKFGERTRLLFDASPFFRKLLDGNGLTVSLGLAYGRSRTPFNILLSQAEELLKSAKKAGAKDDRTKGFYIPSYIDYHFTSLFNQVSVDESRKSQLQLQGPKPLLFYQKPYILEDAEALLNYAKNFVEIGVAKSRLNGFGQAMLLGKVNSTIACLSLYTRMSDKHRLAFYEALDRFGCMGGDMPWRNQDSHYTSVLMDLIELTAFV